MGSAMERISNSNEEENELRRGPWTLEEDTLLTRYVTHHGEGRWNLAAKSAGLKRIGKSCRLRWLNYLKPDIKRGNLTPQEQLLILDLHSKLGNRWSKIAQHLPGRTDNEIKNFWRTNCKRFPDAVRCFWQPRLLQKLEQSSDSSAPDKDLDDSQTLADFTFSASLRNSAINPFLSSESSDRLMNKLSGQYYCSNPGNENDSMASQHQTEIPEDPGVCNSIPGENYCIQTNGYEMDYGFNPVPELGRYHSSPSERQMAECNWVSDDDLANDLWSMKYMWEF